MKLLTFKLFWLVGILFWTNQLSAQINAKNELLLKQASNHFMQYYVSLPNDWRPDKKWPVILVLEAAEKEYQKNALRFVEARRDLPFVIVAPIHMSNGRQGRRDETLFPYSPDTWDYIDKIGDCEFDDTGIRQVLADVKANYNTEDKAYVTGFEAGTHVLWMLVLNNPELIKAAAPVAGNFRSRCVDVNSISADPSKTTIPVMSFTGDKDSTFGPNGVLYAQWSDAKAIAQKNGFKNVRETIIHGKVHEPMPDEVVQYFLQLYRK